MKNSTSIFHHALHAFDNLVFSSPKTVLAVLLLVTAFFGMQIPGVRMYSDFADLLPQEHPYIQLHNQIRDSFGGANNIIMSVEVKQGDLFTDDVIKRIARITNKIDQLPGVNHNTVASITHRTVRKVWLTETGDVNSAPYFDGLKPGWSDDELAQVMGHEISHALAKHSAEKMSMQIATSVGVAAVGIASDNTGVALTGAALTAMLAVNLPNSRAAETEADRIGIELAAKAGYDPAAAAA